MREQVPRSSSVPAALELVQQAGGARTPAQLLARLRAARLLVEQQHSRQRRPEARFGVRPARGGHGAAPAGASRRRLGELAGRWMIVGRAGVVAWGTPLERTDDKVGEIVHVDRLHVLAAVADEDPFVCRGTWRGGDGGRK